MHYIISILEPICDIHYYMPKTIIVFAVVVELVIELSQLVSTRGLAEWDDIIHGAVGALIGYWIYRFVKEYIIKNNRDRVKIGYH